MGLTFNRRRLLAATALATLLSPVMTLQSRAAPVLRLIKDPNCGCCEGHAAYLQENGFAVTVEESSELDALRKLHRVPDHLVGCHIIFADTYVIEGHVPAAAITRLLSERPSIRGISVPGMPEGSPGMSGTKEAPLIVYEIADTGMKVFMTE